MKNLIQNLLLSSAILGLSYARVQSAIATPMPAVDRDKSAASEDVLKGVMRPKICKGLAFGQQIFGLSERLFAEC